MMMHSTPPTAQAPVFTPSRVLRVWGMRRSGNHAVINWLMRNSPEGDAVFLNNCQRGRDPLFTHRNLEVFGGGEPAKADKGLPLENRLAQAGPSPMAIVSIEDGMPTTADKRRPLWDAPETTVVIYRGFLNWAASLLHKIKGNPAYGPLDRARIMTAALRGYTRALEIASDPEGWNAVCVLYDDWVESDRARRETLAALDLPARDLSLGKVQRYGGGSSFQPDARRAEELTSGSRSAELTGDPEYMMLLWIAAHDAFFTEKLIAHFPDDARRLAELAENAKLDIHLPAEERH